jgi:glycosyltransferase involved in cell wall biosynthesis
MRIAFINNFYNQGGSSLAAYELAKKLSPQNEMSFYGSVDGPFREKFSSIGESHLVRAQNFEYDMHLIDLVNKFNPDVIHVFIPGEQRLGYFNYLPKCKRFASVLCGQTIGFDTTQFDKVLFSSKYQVDLNPHVSNYEIVRYGVECNEIESAQKDIPVFGRIASYCPSKMIHDTLYCANECRENKFIVAGEILDPAYFKAMNAYRKYFGNDNITIKGSVTDDERQQIMNEIDVYHYPSSNEAFCFSILEAFANKKPVISYKDSAIPELFDSDEWLCDDLDGLVDLTKKMQSLSKEERQQIGNVNYLKYKQHSTEIYADKINNLYGQVYSQNS